MKRSFLLCLPLLTACSSMPKLSMPDLSLPSWSSLVTPYRMDVQQGNLVTQDMASQLKAGMTKEQVRYALGTPLLTDVFHKDRWDYVYQYSKGSGPAQERRIALFFEDGKLTRVDGDAVPASAGGASGLQTTQNVYNRAVEFKLPDGAKLPSPEEPVATPSTATKTWNWVKSLWPF